VEAGVVGKPSSFTTFQSLVALIAGLTSIVGAAYSAVGNIHSTPPPGEIVAVVRDAGNQQPVPTAVVEVLTPEDALVTMLPHTDGGTARGAVAPGAYRVRVTHPDFVEVIRDVRVVEDGTAELQLALAHRPHRAAIRAEPDDADGASRAHHGGQARTTGAAVDHGIAVGRRMLSRFGF
jgi:hypothetical protein